MKRRVAYGCATLLGAVSLLSSGCISEPESLIQQVEKAKEEVREAGAETYAADALAAADEAAAAAEAEVALQREKFVLTRNYKTATAKLNEALAALNQVAAEAAAAKGSMKGPVRALTKDATLAVDAAEQELAKAMVARRGGDVTVWANELAALRQLLQDASDAERKGDFITAKAKLDAAFAGANTLATNIQQGLAGG